MSVFIKKQWEIILAHYVMYYLSSLFLDKDMKIEANDNVSLMVMMSLYKTKP